MPIQPHPVQLKRNGKSVPKIPKYGRYIIFGLHASIRNFVWISVLMILTWAVVGQIAKSCSSIPRRKRHWKGCAKFLHNLLNLCTESSNNACRIIYFGGGQNCDIARFKNKKVKSITHFIQVVFDIALSVPIFTTKRLYSHIRVLQLLIDLPQHMS